MIYYCNKMESVLNFKLSIYLNLNNWLINTITIKIFKLLIQPKYLDIYSFMIKKYKYIK